MHASTAAAVTSSTSVERAVLARIVPSNNDLEECGSRLRGGDLVAFPTETVYGLGCNALDSNAITKVFEAKERPLTDPLIVHVNDRSSAFELWEAEPDSCEGKVLNALCDRFWPGPLTIVAKAKESVPPILMANTGFVACRSPSGNIARRLIDAARVPLAAPSANKFGHVSPTTASHVWDDLLHEDVWIVDSESPGSSSDADDAVCNVGVESTVAKVEAAASEDSKGPGRILLLRQGAVSVQDIAACLEASGLSDLFDVETRTKKTTSDHVATVAPGQSIRHYSPNIPSFMVSTSRCKDESSPLSEEEKQFLKSSIIIDFGGLLRRWQSLSVAYRDLSPSGDSAEAAKTVFATLRWTEQVKGSVQRVIFPEIEEDPDANDALRLALKDKMTRAASGNIIDSLRD
eukprot:CAMPEP_0119548950 /NCGR_PEP_ID=MMETSP1352-20130426/2750_1 /TAXON_ID=265584 /ORGANISM="Stauroneis constricta, Strain CCMP1120" /LENGTH=403 /DNA_ID=CAMNT_0007594363 /DNA_START=405 /DNA_END=1616 /DNA_ORIENTATION=+